MNEQPFDEQSRISIHLERVDFVFKPAETITIPLLVRNQGHEADSFVLSVEGLSEAWISSSLPDVDLFPGEQKEVYLNLQAPALQEGEPGQQSVTIRATSKNYPDQFTEAVVTLSITPEQPLDRIAVELESQQFSVAPGSSTTFNLRLRNNGLTVDVIRLSIEGITTSWVSTPSPITQLEPGEEREIPITISVPRSTQSRAGRNRFTIRAVSQEDPDQAVEIGCVLTIGAYTQFTSELVPTGLQAGQNAQIKVANQGNVNEAFKINWQSEDDLAFQLWQQQGEEQLFTEAQQDQLKVGAGQQGSIYFKTGLRRRPLVGRTATYPFQVEVQSSAGEVQTSRGEVEDKPLIPLWVIPIVIALCLSLVCVAVIYVTWPQGEDTTTATQTALAATQESLQVTQTFVAQETQNA